MKGEVFSSGVSSLIIGQIKRIIGKLIKLEKKKEHCLSTMLFACSQPRKSQIIMHIYLIEFETLLPITTKCKMMKNLVSKN